MTTQGRTRRARRKRVDQSFSEQPQFETLFAELSTSFIALPADDIDLAIAGSLKRIADYLGIDQIGLLELSDEKTRLCVARYWVNPGTGLPPSAFVLEDFPWTVKRLVSGGTIRMNRIDDLPPEAARDKKAYISLGARSIVILPLDVGGWMVGAVWFAALRRERTWSDALVEQFRLLGGIFSNALKRKRMVAAIRSSDALKTTILASLDSSIVVLDETGTIIAANDAWLRFGQERGASQTAIGVGANYFEVYEKASTSGNKEVDKVLHGIRAVCSGSIPHFEYEYACPSPTQQCWYLVSVTQLKRPEGGAVVAYKDITDRKRDIDDNKKLSDRLIRALEEERRRIARELHDDISQKLVLLGLELNKVAAKLPASAVGVSERIHLLENRAGELATGVQALSHELHSSQVDYVGLVAAVSRFCEEYSDRHHLTIKFKQHFVPAGIPSDISLCVFRVLQEALRNIVKHSRAQQVEVELIGSANELRLRVRDLGIGFDPELVKRKGGLGLLSMQERLDLVGGELSIHSRPTQGTEIVASVPVSSSNAAVTSLKAA